MNSYRRAIPLLLTAILLLDATGIGLGVAQSLGRSSLPGEARHVGGRAAELSMLDVGGTWRRSGPVLLTHALAIDPFRPTVVYASTIAGVLRSTDAGSHWQPSDVGLDPSDQEVWQVATTGVRGGLVAAAAAGAVYRSSDGGGRWQRAGPRLDPGGIFAVVADPSHPTVLLAGSSEGIWRSGDSGSHWSLVASAGGSGVDAFAWQAGTSHVCAGLSAGPHQVLASVDGGRTWRSSTLGLGGQEGIMALLLPRSDPRTLLAGTMGQRIWRRDERGMWRPSGDGFPGGEHGTALAEHGDLLWSSTMTSGVFASADGGRSWRPYGRGLAASGRVVLALAATGGRLLAGSSDGIYLLDAGT